jgi:hypothetical protein
VGPLSLQQLVESLLTLPDPPGCLVWRRGLPAWTRASGVPQVADRLAPFVTERAPTPPATPALTNVTELDASPEQPAAVAPSAAPSYAKVASLLRQPQGYLAAAAVCVLLAIASWGLWFRTPGPEASSGHLATGSGSKSGTTTATRLPGPDAAPTDVDPGSANPAIRPEAAARFAGWEEEESALDVSELPKLRGVAGWTDTRLTVTVYNGSTWRITELAVRVSRLEGEEFVDALSLDRLFAVPGKIDADVAQLLDKVAPDRRRPAVNPLDTGRFEGEVGPRPEAYRWKIEGAKGYAPLAGR